MEATTPTLDREEIREERSKGDLPILVAGMVGAFFMILQCLEDGTTVLVALGTALILAGMVWIGATRLYSVDDFGRWVSFVTVSFAASLGGALVQTLRVESPKAECASPTSFSRCSPSPLSCATGGARIAGSSRRRRRLAARPTSSDLGALTCAPTPRSRALPRFAPRGCHSG